MCCGSMTYIALLSGACHTWYTRNYRHFEIIPSFSVVYVDWIRVNEPKGKHFIFYIHQRISQLLKFVSQLGIKRFLDSESDKSNTFSYLDNVTNCRCGCAENLAIWVFLQFTRIVASIILFWQIYFIFWFVLITLLAALTHCKYIFYKFWLALCIPFLFLFLGL